ncbi:hypothetical protein [Streptomyces sp. CB03238]|nr:hypothetical protein [Streptomyces sp. CB03238]
MTDRAPGGAGAVAGAALFTSGSVRCRMSAHAEAMRALDELADRPSS